MLSCLNLILITYLNDDFDKHLTKTDLQKE